MISWAGHRAVGMDGWTDRPLWHIIPCLLTISFNTVLKFLAVYHSLFLTALFLSTQTLCCSSVSSLVLEQPCLLAIWLWNTGTLGSTSHTVHRHEAKRKRLEKGRWSSSRAGLKKKKNRKRRSWDGGTKPYLQCQGRFKRFFSDRKDGYSWTSFTAKGVERKRQRKDTAGGYLTGRYRSSQWPPPAHSIPREDVRTSPAAICRGYISSQGKTAWSTWQNEDCATRCQESPPLFNGFIVLALTSAKAKRKQM